MQKFTILRIIARDIKIRVKKNVFCVALRCKELCKISQNAMSSRTNKSFTLIDMNIPSNIDVSTSRLQLF